MRSTTRAEVLLSTQWEAEQLRAVAAYYEAKERELAELRSKTGRLKGVVNRLHSKCDDA